MGLQFGIILLFGLSASVFAASPVYNYDYLEDDCVPHDDPNPRERHLTWPNSSLYGYVNVVRSGGYSPNMDCEIKIVAPPGHKLVVRIARIELYNRASTCIANYMEIEGETEAPFRYCGYGAVPYSMYSTSEWLKFRIHTSHVDEFHDDIGFTLYYTALHEEPCINNANTSEYHCESYGWCAPAEVGCDGRDNCGDWSEEDVSHCGLSRTAVIAISVVCSLIGAVLLGFIIYYIYTKQREKRRHRNDQNETRPRRSATPSGRGSRDSAPATIPVPPRYEGPLGELPPAYTEVYDISGNATEANTEYETIPEAIGQMRRNSSALSAMPIGEPPPLYSNNSNWDSNPTYQTTASMDRGVDTAGTVSATDRHTSDTTVRQTPSSQTTGASNRETGATGGHYNVSFDPLPEKFTDS